MINATGVTFFINDKNLPVKGFVKSSYDKDENLIVEFIVGKSKSDKVKIIFDKRTYLDVEE